MTLYAYTKCMVPDLLWPPGIFSLTVISGGHQ